MDLFERAAERDQAGAPLPERMRPQRLEDVVGQQHLLGPGKMLRRLLESAQLPSLILWGPPGTGKTTLARVLAAQIGAELVPLSATAAGVKEVREEVAAARQRLALHRKRTLLFIDEIHRFNKGQQDALLPHVERGTVILVGATTENPSFEVNAALLSRCRVLVLQALSDDDVLLLLKRALSDTAHGLGAQHVEVEDAALAAIVEQSGGDARRALTTLEVAAGLARGSGRAVDPALVAEAAQKRMLLYDKAGEEHFNVVSAFIKSMRGSDPDAAVYWMVRMLEAGEDPLFVVRRMVIFAAEDIGNADPQALVVAVACQQAVHFIGMPEAVLPMTQAALYLACAPKANGALTAYANARRDVVEQGALPVPLHLRNAATGLMRHLGYGKDYKYPHDLGGVVPGERYLPDALAGRVYYAPKPGEPPRPQSLGPGPSGSKK